MLFEEEIIEIAAGINSKRAKLDVTDIFAFFRRESIDLKAGIFDLKAGKIAVKVPQKTCENSVHIIV